MRLFYRFNTEKSANTNTSQVLTQIDNKIIDLKNQSDNNKEEIKHNKKSLETIQSNFNDDTNIENEENGMF